MRSFWPILIVSALVVGALGYYCSGPSGKYEITMYRDFKRDRITELEYMSLIRTYNLCFEPDTRENYYGFLKQENREGLSEAILKKRTEEIVEYAKLDAMSQFDQGKSTAIARLDGKIIGLYTCYDDDKFQDNTIMVWSVCIAPKYRGYGYGKKLFQHAIDNCRVPGKNLALVVYKNKPSIKMYENMDFVISPMSKIPKDPYQVFNKYFMVYKGK